MQLQALTNAYELFTQARAQLEGKNESQIKAEISAEVFEQRLRELHQRWLLGEISFGKFTELMGVPHWELWEILDFMGLPRYK